MKIDVDYDVLQHAVGKLKSHSDLTEDENEALLKLALATVGDYYPTQTELISQRSRVKRLTLELFESNREEYNRLLAECTKFENKYC